MKRPGVAPAAALFLLTCILILYRIVWLGYPVLPAVKGQAWQLLVSVYVAPGEEGSVRLSLALPREHTGYMIAEERFLSGAYALDTMTEGPNRFGVWSAESIDAPQEISYRATIHSRPPSASRSNRPC